MVSHLKYFLVLLQLSLFQVFAQNFSEKELAPVEGDSLAYVSGPYVNPGPEGAYQFWDFSKITFSTSIYSDVYIKPSQPNLIDPYKSAKVICKRISAQNGQYSIVESSGIYDYVVCAESNCLNVVDPSKTNVLIKMPYVRFSNNIGESEANSYIFISKTSPSSNNSVYRFVSVDASGILKTPSATYLNTIRIHRKTSSRTQSGSNIARVSEYSEDIYEWYSPNIHGPVLAVYTSTYNSGYPPYNGPSIGGFTKIYSHPSHPLRLINFLGNLLSFENPVSDQAIVYINPKSVNSATIKILEFSCKILKVFNVNDTYLKFDVSDLPTGVYILSIETNTGEYERKKLIVRR